MHKIQLFPYIKYIVPQTGKCVWWCWSNTWSLAIQTVIWPSVQYVSRK